MHFITLQAACAVWHMYLHARKSCFENILPAIQMSRAFGVSEMAPIAIPEWIIKQSVKGA
jgi:hypothetical protein